MEQVSKLKKENKQLKQKEQKLEALVKQLRAQVQSETDDKGSNH